MKEFYHLENIKNNNPYSDNALKFTDGNNTNTSSRLYQQRSI